jgi:hypothetical protein
MKGDAATKKDVQNKELKQLLFITELLKVVLSTGKELVSLVKVALVAVIVLTVSVCEQENMISREVTRYYICQCKNACCW